jgi:hypothetical protein
MVVLTESTVLEMKRHESREDAIVVEQAER